MSWIIKMRYLNLNSRGRFNCQLRVNYKTGLVDAIAGHCGESNLSRTLASGLVQLEDSLLSYVSIIPVTAAELSLTIFLG